MTKIKKIYNQIFSQKIKEIGRLTLPILFPVHCPVCNNPVSYGRRVCPDCYRLLPFIRPPFCRKCGKPIRDDRQELCYDCRIFPKSFQSGCSLLLYNRVSKPAMIDYKYHNRRVLTEFYTQELKDRYYPLFKLWKPQAVLPVPVHEEKRRYRGYNQAGLLSRSLAEKLSLPHFEDLLIRTRGTLPQKQFTPQARLANLNRAFALNPACAGTAKRIDRILLVDDIYTTGATLEACTRILESAGIRRVYVCTVCIGESRD